MKEYTKKGVERKFPYCDYQFVPKSPWNYGYSNTNFEVKFNGISDVPFSQKNPPVTIKANMQDTLYRKNRGRTDTKGEAETLSRHTKMCATR